jgi:hypothetical protein
MAKTYRQYGRFDCERRGAIRMETVERYIYAVTRKLPEKQRDDIEKELRGLIEDMLEDRTSGQEPSTADIEEVLIELGSPSEMADQYREKKQYLIGPGIVNTYFLVLKIVLAAIAFGITVALTIGYFVNPPQSLFEIIINYFGTLIAALFQGFAWVTIIFAVIERYDPSAGKGTEDEKWTPADLPPLPSRETVIGPIEPIVGLIFAIIGFVIFNTADHLIGIYFVSEEGATRVIPLFNHEVFRSLLPLLNIMIAIGVIKESLKLIVGKWTPVLAYLNTAFNLVSFGLFLTFIRSEGLWNSAFFDFWVEAGLISPEADPLLLWGRVIAGFIAIVGIAFIIDTITSLVKALKYRASK